MKKPSTTTVNFINLIASIIITSLMSACSQQIDPATAADQTEVSTAAARLNNSVTDSTATLKSSASFPIGVAFNSTIVKKSAKANRLFYDQFNAKTVHAYMNTQPTQGKFNLAEVDYWVNEAAKRPIRLHGHCLVHRMDASSWFSQYSGNTAGFESAVKTHIQTLVSRHKGKIKSWDVVNEIFDTNSGAIRQTSFRQLYASDAAYLEFIKRCFQWAHEADPNALLFYNDFYLESSASKLAAVVALVTDLRRNGVQIDGIGTQMHIDINTSEAGIRNAYQRLAATGLLVHVSELDIAVNPKNVASMSFTQEVKDAQAVKYQIVASLYKQNVPVRLQYGITLWDFSDADSWLLTHQNKYDMPNVFDGNYNKKPAFFGLLQGVKN